MPVVVVVSVIWERRTESPSFIHDYFPIDIGLFFDENVSNAQGESLRVKKVGEDL